MNFRRDVNSRTLIMGILNCTPDSFSDGGLYIDHDKAVDHALKMIEEGCDIVDVGGESTRPGYTPVDDEVELSRVLPVVKTLASGKAMISVDTTSDLVASKCVEACGRMIINDISGDLKASNFASLAATNGCGLVIMFNARRNGECGGSIIGRAVAEVSDNIEFALSKGVKEDNIIVDPGIGFGTTREQDIELTNELAKLSFDGRFPILYAASRKRIIKELSGFSSDPDLRDDASDALALFAVSRGASIIRTHRIAPLKAQLEVFDRFTGG